MPLQTPLHGGPDDGPQIDWDFSSNANAVPLPQALYDKLTGADRRLYPDPQYTALREHLASVQGVASSRIVPTAGSSEVIRRLTLAAYLRGIRQVWVPRPAYGDYEAAAHALGMSVAVYDNPMQANGDALLWLCEPCNPTGQSKSAAFWSSLAEHGRLHPDLVVAVDRAYEPLRLHGDDPVDDCVADVCWQLWSPNKALGLTGVRAGWMQTPLLTGDGVQALHAAVQALAPSWVVSAEGIQLLMHWHDDDVQSWLKAARCELNIWMQAMQHDLTQLGWYCQPSVVPFFLLQSMTDDISNMPHLLSFLREQGIKLRDTGSMGLPGRLRLRAHVPQAQEALRQALFAWAMQAASPRMSA